MIQTLNYHNFFHEKKKGLHNENLSFNQNDELK
jgi:hypothetical protein